ncbi:acyl-CoA desaturase [Streptomyces lydicus]|uniref:acyl-CoA desaturase n=1 Tax=Streptomyces lydicus TaxID=47763 RepID=UPI0037136075
MTTGGLGVSAADAPPGGDAAGRSRPAAAGLPRWRRGSCAVRMPLVGAAYAGGWVVFFVLGDSWWQLAVAGGWAPVFGQIALVSHGLAHGRVFRGRRASGIGGRLCGNLGVGMSYGWWVERRSRQHAHRRQEEFSAEGSPGLLGWARQQAGAAGGPPRGVGRHRLQRFFPLRTLEGCLLRVASIRALRSPTLTCWGTEAVLLLAHLTLYLGALFLVLSPGKALAFLLVHQGAFGMFLGRAFPPAHRAATRPAQGDR